MTTKRAEVTQTPCSCGVAHDLSNVEVSDCRCGARMRKTSMGDIGYVVDVSRMRGPEAAFEFKDGKIKAVR